MVICPSRTRPREIVEKAIAVFQRELKASGIILTFQEDSSINDFDVDWVMLDQQRFVQVLFNLITNSIKVVKNMSEPRRNIVVKLSASSNKTPSDGLIRFVKPRHPSRPVDFGDLREHSEAFFLVTTVEDTGPGLSTEELEGLFERFAQESPKTESKYGGSGLGLFISRDLTELQGGRIGMASEAGRGSKFVFSVEATRCDPPKFGPEEQQLPPVVGMRHQESMSNPSPIVDLPPELPSSEEQLREHDRLKEMRGARKILYVVCHNLVLKVRAENAAGSSRIIWSIRRSLKINFESVVTKSAPRRTEWKLSGN